MFADNAQLQMTIQFSIAFHIQLPPVLRRANATDAIIFAKTKGDRFQSFHCLQGIDIVTIDQNMVRGQGCKLAERALDLL